MLTKLVKLTCSSVFLIALCGSVGAVTLEPVGELSCSDVRQNCEYLDAIVFVHGIYGSEATFKNKKAEFDWPTMFPRTFDDRKIDVYRLSYDSEMFSWLKQKNPKFIDVADGIFLAMTPLRKKSYRSIGFIAHSLGGNFVSTYLNDLKDRQGHPERAKNAFVITLATPVLGAEIASFLRPFKKTIGINDDLLRSLEKDNLFLEMLLRAREGEGGKVSRLGCRSVSLHAAYEEPKIKSMKVVSNKSAALSITNLLSSPIFESPLNHLQISKPGSVQDPIYLWVNEKVTSEMDRLTNWDSSRESVDIKYKLCQRVEYIGERG